MSWWTERQDKDPFVKLRDKNNYISRAYFKIEEIQQKFKVFKNDDFILDLGAAPGGWCQYFAKFSKNLYAVDILDNFLVKNVHFQCGDVYDNQLLENLPNFNLVCSDMAPNLCGNKFIDCAKTINLCERALEIAQKKLHHKGNFLTKIFEGQDFDLFIKKCKNLFFDVNVCKPKASRNESRELYIVCKKLK